MGDRVANMKHKRMYFVSSTHFIKFSGQLTETMSKRSLRNKAEGKLDVKVK